MIMIVVDRPDFAQTSMDQNGGFDPPDY